MSWKTCSENDQLIYIAEKKKRQCAIELLFLIPGQICENTMEIRTHPSF